MIDTHCHIYLPEFDADRAEMIQRAKDAQVTAIFLPNIDSGSISDMMQVAAQYPAYCFPMMGLHPCSVRGNYLSELEIIGKQWEENADSFYGVGECGLDYYWDKTFVQEQKEVFNRHMQWAKKYRKPLIIHSRDSIGDCIAMVEAAASDDLFGIFHCFSGNEDQLERIIGLGFLAGIGGVSTFKNGGLDRVLKKENLPHLVLETDAPYLAPVPFRGKRNEPAYLPFIRDRLAAILAMSPEEIVAATNANATRIFKR